MATVAIMKGINPPDITVEALEMVDAYEALSEEKPFLIKPNYIDASHPSNRDHNRQ